MYNRLLFKKAQIEGEKEVKVSNVIENPKSIDIKFIFASVLTRMKRI